MLTWDMTPLSIGVSINSIFQASLTLPGWLAGDFPTDWWACCYDLCDCIARENRLMEYFICLEAVAEMIKIDSDALQGCCWDCCSDLTVS